MSAQVAVRRSVPRLIEATNSMGKREGRDRHGAWCLAGTVYIHKDQASQSSLPSALPFPQTFGHWTMTLAQSSNLSNPAPVLLPAGNKHFLLHVYCVCANLSSSIIH